EGVIREIAALTTLEDVSLAGTTGDEENIEALSALELQSLDLSGTNVNDGDLAAIAKIRTLRTLKINCTDVSDTGLRCLLGLPAFERLEVSDSAVTDSALDHFEQAEPSVEVVRKFDAAVTGGVY